MYISIDISLDYAVTKLHLPSLCSIKLKLNDSNITWNYLKLTLERGIDKNGH